MYNYLAGYSITTQHHIDQGQPDGTVAETMIYDANTDMFSGGAWFDGKGLGFIVRE